MDIIGYNEDLITVILLYLPVKSILRFKSVSRQWNNLLSSSRFIQRHASLQTMSNSNLYFHLHGIKSLHLKQYSRRLDTVNFDFLNNTSRNCLVNIKSCNGLLLVQSNNFGLRDEHRPRQRFYHVYNPFTRKHSELVVPDYIATIRHMYCNLAFDPSISPHYKVIFCWRVGNIFCDNYHIAIYSSETRSCKKLGYTFESRFDWLYSGVYLNGAIHWISDLKLITSIDNIKKTSIYFDMNRELIKVYPMPPRSSLANGCMYFGKCRGHLTIVLDDEEAQRILDVYELYEDYSRWFVKYRIDLDVIAVGFPEIIIRGNNSEKRYNYTFLYILESDSEDPAFVVAVGNKLLAYDLEEKTTKKLCVVGDGTDQACSNLCNRYFRACWWYDVVHCTENLFAV